MMLSQILNMLKPLPPREVVALGYFPKLGRSMILRDKVPESFKKHIRFLTDDEGAMEAWLAGASDDVMDVMSKHIPWHLFRPAQKKDWPTEIVEPTSVFQFVRCSMDEQGNVTSSAPRFAE